MTSSLSSLIAFNEAFNHRLNNPQRIGRLKSPASPLCEWRRPTELLGNAATFEFYCLFCLQCGNLQGFEVRSRISLLSLYDVVRKVAADNARTWDLNSGMELDEGLRLLWSVCPLISWIRGLLEVVLYYYVLGAHCKMFADRPVGTTDLGAGRWRQLVLPLQCTLNKMSRSSHSSSL